MRNDPSDVTWQASPDGDILVFTACRRRGGIEHARGKANDERAYLGRKPSCTHRQFAKVRDMLAQAAVGITAIAQEVGLSRQAVYRIKDGLAGAEAALAAWGCSGLTADLRRTLVWLAIDGRGVTRARRHRGVNARARLPSRNAGGARPRWPSDGHDRCAARPIKVECYRIADTGRAPRSRPTDRGLGPSKPPSCPCRLAFDPPPTPRTDLPKKFGSHFGGTHPTRQPRRKSKVNNQPSAGRDHPCGRRCGCSQLPRAGCSTAVRGHRGAPASSDTFLTISRCNC